MMEICSQAASVWLPEGSDMIQGCSFNSYQELDLFSSCIWVHSSGKERSPSVAQIGVWEENRFHSVLLFVAKWHVGYLVKSNLKNSEISNLKQVDTSTRKRKLVRDSTKPKNALLYLHSDSHQEILGFVLSVMCCYISLLTGSFKTYIEYLHVWSTALHKCGWESKDKENLLSVHKEVISVCVFVCMFVCIYVGGGVKQADK